MGQMPDFYFFVPSAWCVQFLSRWWVGVCLVPGILHLICSGPQGRLFDVKTLQGSHRGPTAGVLCTLNGRVPRVHNSSGREREGHGAWASGVVPLGWPGWHGVTGDSRLGGTTGENHLRRRWGGCFPRDSWYGAYGTGSCLVRYRQGVNLEGGGKGGHGGSKGPPRSSWVISPLGLPTVPSVCPLGGL